MKLISNTNIFVSALYAAIVCVITAGAQTYSQSDPSDPSTQPYPPPPPGQQQYVPPPQQPGGYAPPPPYGPPVPPPPPYYAGGYNPYAAYMGGMYGPGMYGGMMSPMAFGGFNPFAMGFGGGMFRGGYDDKKRR